MSLSHREITDDAVKLVTDIVTNLPVTQPPAKERESLDDARKILLKSAAIIEQMLKDKVDPTMH